MTRFKEYGMSAASAVLERVGRGVGRMQERKSLPADLLESDDAFLVVFDAPGTTRSDVQVRFVDGEVQVQIDRFRDYYDGYDMRFPGRGLSLDGRVELPDAVDAEGATATLTESGVLKVRIPKETARDVTVEGESVDVEARGEEAERAEDAGDDTEGDEADDADDADEGDGDEDAGTTAEEDDEDG